MSFNDFRSGRLPSSSALQPPASSAPQASYRPQASTRPGAPMSMPSMSGGVTMPPMSTAGGGGSQEYISARPAPKPQWGGNTDGSGGIATVDTHYLSMRPSSAMESLGGVGGGAGGGAGGAGGVEPIPGNLQGWREVCELATNPAEVAPPKAKYVKAIMQGIQNGGSMKNTETPVGGAFAALRKLLPPDNRDPVSVLKCLILFHHIFREGNEKFTEYIASNARGIFNDAKNLSASDPVLNAIIAPYACYLDQWCAMKSYINYPPVKVKEGKEDRFMHQYREASLEMLFKHTPVLLDTLTKLFAVDLTKQQGQPAQAKSPLTAPAIVMILKDLTYLWVSASEAVLTITNQFFHFEPGDSVTGFEIYEKFREVYYKAKPYFETARAVNPRWMPPYLNLVPLNLTTSMEEYVRYGPSAEVLHPDDYNYGSEEDQGGGLYETDDYDDYGGGGGPPRRPPGGGGGPEVAVPQPSYRPPPAAGATQPSGPGGNPYTSSRGPVGGGAPNPYTSSRGRLGSAPAPQSSTRPPEPPHQQRRPVVDSDSDSDLSDSDKSSSDSDTPKKKLKSKSSKSKSKKSSSKSKSKSKKKDDSDDGEDETRKQRAEEMIRQQMSQHPQHQPSMRPQMSNRPQAYDPINELLGIASDPNKSLTPQQQMLLYQSYHKGLFENSDDERVKNIKNMMQALSGGAPPMTGGGNPAAMNSVSGGMTPQQQLALYNSQRAAGMANMYKSQQMAAMQSMRGGMNPNMMMMSQRGGMTPQQQQQQMVLYQSMRGAGGNNMMMVPHVQNGMAGMTGMSPGMQLAQYGGYQGGAGMSGNVVPAMQAEVEAKKLYRVQRNTKEANVNSSDKNFGHLIDDMKKAALASNNKPAQNYGTSFNDINNMGQMNNMNNINSFQ